MLKMVSNMTTTMAAARFYNNLSRIFTKLCLLLNLPCCWSCCSPPSPSPRHPWRLPLTRGFTRGGSMQRRWSSWVLVWLVQTSVRRWELNRENPSFMQNIRYFYTKMKFLLFSRVPHCRHHFVSLQKPLISTGQGYIRKVFAVSKPFQRNAW